MFRLFSSPSHSPSKLLRTVAATAEVPTRTSPLEERVTEQRSAHTYMTMCVRRVRQAASLCLRTILRVHFSPLALTFPRFAHDVCTFFVAKGRGLLYTLPQNLIKSLRRVTQSIYERMTGLKPSARSVLQQIYFEVCFLIKS